MAGESGDLPGLGMVTIRASRFSLGAACGGDTIKNVSESRDKNVRVERKIFILEAVWVRGFI